jgi:hypothetical protein
MSVAAYTLVPALGIGAGITALNATPGTRKTAGQGGTGTIVCNEGFAVAPINMPITNFLPLVRIPTNCIVKKVELLVDSYPSTSLTLSVGLTFSNGGSGATVGATAGVSGFPDGTPAAYLSEYSTTAQTSALSQVVSFSFFALNYAVTTTAPVGGAIDVTFLNGVAGGNSVTDGFYVPSASNKPLWQALSAGGIGGLGAATGATSATVGNAFTTCQTDPGGFFDVCVASNTVGVNTAAVNVGLRVWHTTSGSNL